MNTPNTVALVLALALGAPPGAVLAGPAPAEAPAPPQRTAVDAGAPPAKAGPAAPESRLEQTRGGDDTNTTTNQATLAATLTGNSAINVTTGANTIDSGSFANASGLPMVIQNSGANVLIQNATVINLQLR